MVRCISVSTIHDHQPEEADDLQIDEDGKIRGAGMIVCEIAQGDWRIAAMHEPGVGDLGEWTVLRIADKDLEIRRAVITHLIVDSNGHRKRRLSEAAGKIQRSQVVDQLRTGMNTQA